MNEAQADTPSDASAPQIGARLAGRFVVRRRLGKGGMGIVFEAFDEQRGERVALKTLERLDGAAIYRLKKEFRALSDVVHPNLVRLHELFSDDGRWFFTMACIDGVPFLEQAPGPHGTAHDTTLEAPSDPAIDALARTAATPKLPGEHALRRRLAELAAGVAAVHRSGRLHCDLKPSNVIVDAAGHVTILDFGLARAVGPTDASQDLAVAGTPAYMAPEQLTPSGACPASDWYAVGGMLYEALTGRLPFAGGVVEALVAAQRGHEPAHPTKLVPSAPADLADLALELLRADPETRASEAAIVAIVGRPSGASEPTPAARATPFVGREAELGRLRRAFAAVRGGEPCVAYLAGPSGIGKTALVERLLAQIRGEALILAGRCYEREAVPFKALDAVVDALSRQLQELGAVAAARATPRDATELCRVFPVLERIPAFAQAVRAAERADPEEVRRRAFLALKETFARVAGALPLVIFIDDLQWGDVDSGAFLTELLAPPDPPRVLLLGSYRSDELEQSPLLVALRSHAERNPRQRIETLTLEPLPEPDARALAAALLGVEAGGARAQAIAAEARGNPFFVSELARARESSAGATLAELVETRVAALPADARALLEVVAVAAVPLRRDAALAAAGLDAATDAAIPLLVTGSLLRSSGTGPEDTVQTYHDRIRETVAAALGEERARVCHASLAAALERLPDPPAAQLAIHHREAGHRDEARAWALRAAGRAADAVAFDRAAELYRQALDLLPERAEAEERRDLERRLGEALASSGRGVEAARLFLRAAEGASGAEAIELQRQAAYELIHCGELKRGLEIARAVMKGVGLWMPRSPVLAVLVGSVVILYCFFRPVPAERPAEGLDPAELQRVDISYSLGAALVVIEFPPGTFLVAMALLRAFRAADRRRLALQAGVSVLAACIARVPAGRVARRLADARRRSESLADTRLTGQILLWGAIAAFNSGDYVGALALCDEAEPLLARAPGTTVELSYVRAHRMWSQFSVGAIKDLSLQVPALAKMAEQRGNRWMLNVLRSASGSTARLASDEPGIAATEASEALAAWPGDRFQVQHFDFLLARGLIDLYAGRAGELRDLIEAQRPALRRSGLLLIGVIRMRMLDLEARSALAVAAAGPRADGVRGHARRAARAGKRVSRFGVGGAAPLGELAQAGAAHLLGDDAKSRALLERAVAGFDASGMRLYAAVSRARLGQLRGGDDGAALAARARAFMLGQDIVRPERFVAMLAPGFPDTTGDLLTAHGGPV